MPGAEEFLHPLGGIDFRRIDVAARVDADIVQPVELAQLHAAASYAAQLLQVAAVEDVDGHVGIVADIEAALRPVGGEVDRHRGSRNGGARPFTDELLAHETAPARFPVRIGAGLAQIGIQGVEDLDAVVAAVALFHAYVDEGKLSQIGMRLEIPEIFLGLLIGGAAPYLFSAFSINAVGRAAFELINEVRAQFRNDPGIMAGTSKPNYAKCVAIVTAAAQRELIGPGILAIFFPVLVGFGFAIGKPTTIIGGVEYNLVGAQALGGFLAGAILSGQLMAVLLANSGGMWDNAKKLIEDGLHGGKGTDAHKAAVVCDTVGDPFKDTAGPALNPLIKVMNLVGLLLAPAVIMKRPDAVTTGITVAAAIMLIIAIWWSKRGSMGSGMAAAEADAHPTSTGE